MTFASQFDGERLHDGRDPEENEEEIRKNIVIISRAHPLIGRTLDMMMSHSNMGDDMTFHTGLDRAYDNALTLIKRTRKELELDLRQCVEEVAGNYSEFDKEELKKGFQRALSRHDKSIDKLYAWINRLDQRGQGKEDAE